MPALAFALDLYDKTDRLWGVTEVLLASFMASFIFAIFAGQPLCIVGVVSAHPLPSLSVNRPSVHEC